jgi:hypothetical protein
MCAWGAFVICSTISRQNHEADLQGLLNCHCCVCQQVSKNCRLPLQDSRGFQRPPFYLPWQLTASWCCMESVHRAGGISGCNGGAKGGGCSRSKSSGSAGRRGSCCCCRSCCSGCSCSGQRADRPGPQCRTRSAFRGHACIWSCLGALHCCNV